MNNTDTERIEAVTQALTGQVLEINKELVLSTAHMPGTLAAQLDTGEDLGFGCYNTDDGYRVYVVPTDKFPPEIQAAVDLALAHNCKWLVFDSDGPEVEGLQKWNW